jgi:hypothetical protein
MAAPINAHRRRRHLVARIALITLVKVVALPVQIKWARTGVVDPSGEIDL